MAILNRLSAAWKALRGVEAPPPPPERVVLPSPEKGGRAEARGAALERLQGELRWRDERRSAPPAPRAERPWEARRASMGGWGGTD